MTLAPPSHSPHARPEFGGDLPQDLPQPPSDSPVPAPLEQGPERLHGSREKRRWPLLPRRLVASDRLWLSSSAMFSRISNFLCNVILARYGGPAVLGTYSTTLNTATAVVSPVLWALSTSATLEARSAPDEPARRAATAAHVYWSLLIAGISGVAFLILQDGTEVTGDGASPRALGTLTGLIVIVSMLSTAALQGALHGTGVYKPVATRLVAVSLVSMLVAIPAVLVLKLVGALAALSFQYLLLPAALAHLARPCARERARVAAAFGAARRQLRRSVPNLLATSISAGAHWVTTILLVQRSHGMSGVGVFALGLSWLTIEMMAVAAWGGLSLRVLSDAHASSAHEFRVAVRRVLVTDVSFTATIALLVFLCARPISHLYGMANTPLPTILELNSITAIVMAATQAFERSMYCLGQQRLWMRARVIGSLGMLGSALWLLPLRLEYGAIAMLFGYAGTALMCVLHLRRGHWL